MRRRTNCAGLALGVAWCSLLSVGLVGCAGSAAPTAEGLKASIATANEERVTACGSDPAATRPQPLRPLNPQRNTDICRLASFEYERAELDLVLFQKRFGE